MTSDNIIRDKTTAPQEETLIRKVSEDNSLLLLFVVMHSLDLTFVSLNLPLHKILIPLPVT